MTTEELIAAIADYTQSIESTIIDPKTPRRRMTRAQLAKAFDQYIREQFDAAFARAVNTRRIP